MKMWFVFPLLMLMLSPVWLERFYAPEQSGADDYVGVSEGGIGVPPDVTTSEGGIGVPPRH